MDAYFLLLFVSVPQY